ncbi:SIR2 family protein [Myxococcota bacterium]|nr:SIR2 family protein [Myxococcota bacterium]
MAQVFVLHGDLTELACDAWLLPTDYRLGVVWYWRERPALQGVRWDEVQAARPEGWGEPGGVVTTPLAGVPPEAPTPWLTRVGAPSRAPTDRLYGAVAAFVSQAAAAARLRGPRHGRERPLLGLPLVGTGFGGKSRWKGEVAAGLLLALAAMAQQEQVDLALVLKDGRAYAAVQALRRGHPELWPELDDDERAAAHRLGRLAAAGELVVFMGAGAGVGAGLPLWGGLLSELAAEAGMPQEVITRLGALNVLDRARVVARRLEEAGGPSLGMRVAALLERPQYGLAHGLIASLPTREFITTNYDTCFEQACAAAEAPVSALPLALPPPGGRWLLKLHGCVRAPETIVLTRDDYLRYAEDRAALQGVVQALLITRHLLFVGFSLDDDNFHRVADSVRRVFAKVTEGARPSFGAALLPQKSEFAEALWGSEIEWLSMGDKRRPGAADLRAAGRRVEIFLDHLACVAARSADHLLDATYDGALTDAERRVRDQLLPLVALLDADPSLNEGPVGDALNQLLSRLGDPNARRRVSET